MRTATISLIAAVPVAALGVVIWQASRAQREAGAEVAQLSDWAVSVRPLHGTVPAGADPIGSAPQFQNVARLNDTLVVTARSGISVFGADGKRLHEYRVGLELPPAEPSAITVGRLAGSAEPEAFIGTRGAGVLAFNGANFRQILPEAAAARTVTAVHVLGSGRLLIGSAASGLLVFNGHTLAPFHPQLQNAHITALAGTEGDLWIGTLAAGLFHYSGGRLDALRDALPDPEVLALAMDGVVVYAGTPLGVVEFREGHRVRAIADGIFARALAVNNSTLAIGTEDEGVLELKLDAPRRSRLPGEPDGPATVRALCAIGGQTYAVAADGIYVHEAGWQQRIAAGKSLLADRNVAALALIGGRLWIGYFDHGLDILAPGFDRVDHHEDDTLFCVNRITADAAHARTAVATANGLVLFDEQGTPRQTMGRKDGFLSDHVTDVAFRPDGMVVATPAGLSFADRGGVRSLFAFHGLVNNHVYTVAASGNAVIAGTLGGVSVLDNDAVRANYTTANSHLGHNWITSLVEVDGEWFAGTYGAGVLRMDRAGEWHPFSSLPAGLVINPNAMAVSGTRVYAGSLDRGLFVYDRPSARWRAVTAGLPSLNVTALAAGGGHLFVGTENGIVRLAEGSL